MKRFCDPQSRGIFLGLEDGGDAFAAWAAWSEGVRGALREVIAAAGQSSRIGADSLTSVLEACCERSLEESVHVVIDDMLARGASWHHVLLLHVLAQPANPVAPRHAGRLASQVADWLLWRDDELAAPRAANDE